MTAENGTTDAAWTVRRILDWTIGYLKERGSDTPRLDAEILLAHARRCRRIQLYVQYDEPLTEEQRSVMRDLVRRRATAEPVAYLVGHREFFSLDFAVRPGVLIPRPDTEILVLGALDRATGWKEPRILDLCTGTACVPVAIAKNSPRARLQGVELSEAALEVARANVSRHQLESRLELLAGDLFAPLAAGARFEIITSNPPYIPHEEIAELPPTVRDHEPALALDGGADGLTVIRRIIHEAPEFLTPGGWLLLEISPEQAEAAQGLFQERGFVEVSVRNDLSGQARVVEGQWTASPAAG